MSFIHDGLPQITKEAVYHKPVLKQEKLPSLSVSFPAKGRKRPNYYVWQKFVIDGHSQLLAGMQRLD